MTIRFEGPSVNIPHVFGWKQRPWRVLFASCW